MGEELFLEAKDFASKFKSSFSCLLENKNFIDVTLVCHDGQISAHKVILSASSSLFLQILKDNPHPHPLLYLKGISIGQLSSLLRFLYAGEVTVAKNDLDRFLETAKELLIDGLLGKETEQKEVDRKEESVESEKHIKSEPEILDEYQPDYSGYLQQRDNFGQVELAGTSTEVEVFDHDWDKTNKPQRKEGRLLRNPVWDYFIKQDNRSSCITCGFSLLGYSTSTCIKHLENRHPGIYAEYWKKYQVAWSQKMSNQKIALLGPEQEKYHSQPTRRVKGKLNKSPVHHFFTREDHYSNCNYCPAKMLGHSPTTLSKHLEAHHLEQFKQFREMYKQAWENKRKTMEVKMDQQEENYEQWNDTFEISYNDDTHIVNGDDDAQNSYIDWSSTADLQL